MTSQCPQEEQVLALVIALCWPQDADDALRAHVEHCDSCRELAMVAQTLRVDYEETRSLVHPPAAGQVWWRAAVRARMEAAEAAARPLTWAQGVVAAVALGVGAAIVGIAWPGVKGVMQSALSAVAASTPAEAEVIAVVNTASHLGVPLAIVITLCLVLAPLAVYFALSED